MHETIALGQPTFGDEELAAVAEVLKSGWVAGQGPVAKDFEQRFAALCGTSSALTLNNCTAALHLAIQALGAGPGDEVVVADYDELRAITDQHSLWLLEDAACSAGATYQGRPAGSLADAACFSFHGRKGITSGEGGAITTDNAELLAHARKLHFFGIESAFARAGSTDLPVPVFDEIGWNYKLSEIAAAVVSAQLDRLPTLLAARRRVAAGYRELLGDVEEVTLPVELVAKAVREATAAAR